MIHIPPPPPRHLLIDLLGQWLQSQANGSKIFQVPALAIASISAQSLAGVSIRATRENLYRIHDVGS